MGDYNQKRHDNRGTHAVNAKRVNNQSSYIQGNTARQLNVVTAIEEKEVRKLSTSARKNREKAFHMSFGYVLFLTTALVIASFVLIGYIKVQAEITSSIKQVASLENQLHNLKMTNDEEFSRITSAVDLDEVKRIAIEELGMRYASEDQIVVYSSNDSDYVIQLQDIEK